MDALGVAGAEVREGSNRGHMQDFALTLPEPVKGSGLRYAEFGHSGCCTKNGFQGPRGEAGDPRRGCYTHTVAMNVVKLLIYFES